MVRGAVLAGAAVALWLSVAVSVGNTLRAASPATALALMPWDARAKAAVADQGLSLEASRAEVQRSLALARAAIERDPTEARAYRALGLGLSLARDERLVPGLLGYSSRLSRRDLPTQLWLIESAVARNDAAGALEHFSTALTVAPQSKELLFPILVNAVSDPALVQPISGLFRSRPAWGDELLFTLVGRAESVDNLVRLVDGLRARNMAIPQDVTAALIQRLVTAGRYAAAERQYRIASGGRAAWLHDGDFTRTPSFPPLDWLLEDSSNASASISAPAEGQRTGSLDFSARRSSRTPLARQLITAPAGTYRLASTWRIAEGAGGRPAAWVVRCATTSAELGRLPIPVTAAERAVRGAARIAVPADCPAQWVSLELPERNESGDVLGAILSVNLTPLAR